MDRLRNALRRIDGRGYPAYKDIRGHYRGDGFDLEIVHVQGDPFAAPSRLALRLPLSATPLGGRPTSQASRRVGYEDALLRSFHRALLEGSGRRRGSGRSGQWGLLQPGQEILARTACQIDGGGLTVRLTAGLPAAGRRVLGRQAEEMLCEELPVAVRAGLLEADPTLLARHADANQDQDALRELLVASGWVAFVADGAVLPRRSGVDDRPMGGGAVVWRSPPELRAEVQLPCAGRVVGTGLPAGVTLICGGGYHGKSTLLDALARGVYNHVPGDGREQCATVDGAVQVRAEDGRSVSAVDISAFIGALPGGQSTQHFSTQDASGSTSQAAAIVEAIEVGATCLLIDEDTSATPFMVRDRRMQELVAAEREPITPFVDRVGGLYRALGVSTVLVAGGSGDYFDASDRVLVMDAYVARDETARARAIGERFPTQRLAEARPALQRPAARVPLPEGFDARRGRRPERVRARSTRAIELGEQEIDISLLAQVVDDGQARTLGDWLAACARGRVDGRTALAELCASFEQEARTGRLGATTAPGFGDRAMVRRFELAAAINRLRSLRVARGRAGESGDDA